MFTRLKTKSIKEGFKMQQIDVIQAIHAITTASIQSGLSSVANYIMGLGIGVITIGLVISGIKHALGDENAWQRFKNVLIGGIIIFSAGTIAKLLAQFFKGP